MGVAIAKAAIAMGGRVTLIHGPVSQSIIAEAEGSRIIAVENTQQMCDAVLREVLEADILVMAAAPSDYAPLERSKQKIKKDDEIFNIQLKRNPDILQHAAEICREKNHRCVRAGFAAETTDIHHYAQKKLRAKDLDIICLNDISEDGAGFAVDTNRIIVYNRSGERIDLPMQSKYEAAVKILHCCAKYLDKGISDN